jgi:anti-sigma factor RsiW
VECDFADSLLQGYFDCELSAPSAAEFERHLEHCVQCTAELVDLDLLRGQLQFAQLYESAPVSLRKKIRARLRPVAPAIPTPRPVLWHWLAATIALLLLTIVGWKASPVFRTDDYQGELAAEIADAHLRSLQPSHLTTIASNDENVVRAWFGGKVKFAFPVRSFTNEGFPLQGGRLDVVEGRPMIALVYSHERHPVNVFMWTTREQDTALRAGSRHGFQWIDWRKSKVEFCAVSDASASDLEQLQRLLSE